MASIAAGNPTSGLRRDITAPAQRSRLVYIHCLGLSRDKPSLRHVEGLRRTPQSFEANAQRRFTPAYNMSECVKKAGQSSAIMSGGRRSRDYYDAPRKAQRLRSITFDERFTTRPFAPDACGRPCSQPQHKGIDGRDRLTQYRKQDQGTGRPALDDEGSRQPFPADH